MTYFFCFKEIEEQFGHYRTQNESKNIFKAFKTPATLFVVAVFFYFVSGFLGLLGLYPLANLANLMMGLTLVTLCTWAYIRWGARFSFSLQYFFFLFPECITKLLAWTTLTASGYVWVG